MIRVAGNSIFKKRDLPDHLFKIPELDFGDDLFVDQRGSSWLRLGAWTNRSQRDPRGVEDVISRQSVMVPVGQFTEIYGKLESVGNVLHGLGKPEGILRYEGTETAYSYAPFHRFDLSFMAASCEPLVFARHLSTCVELFINPDLELFLGLEEKSNGIWSDPSRGVEALRHRVIKAGNLQIVEVQSDYLRKYLKARQLSLIVAHYRHLHLFCPSPETVEAFVVEDTVQGSPDDGAKAIFQNWGLRDEGLGSAFLQRRLHLWFEIQPPEISVDDPWADEPPFDPYDFTLPTIGGPVAPARWKPFQEDEGRKFEGGTCDFQSRVYFKQEVLSKYEGASGFNVHDDGSVSCHNCWGLARGTLRLGNELLSTNIGDFAEGLPFDEWPHWKQYAVEPPSSQSRDVFREEQPIPVAVNFLAQQLNELNAAFERFAAVIKAGTSTRLWNGSTGSSAGRQLKWVYPMNADDDEFLKRATLMSTLVIDGFAPKSLRKMLQTCGKNLYLSDQGQRLGPRKLMERVTLVAVLIEELQPAFAEIPELVKRAEGQTSCSNEPEPHIELKKLFDATRDKLAPLAILYDLRTHGGLAHSPNRGKVATAVTQLGLSERNWHRTDYLRLLGLVTESVTQIIRHLMAATRILA